MPTPPTPSWLLHSPIDAVVFDCDGTLSQIEGIDWLATVNGVGKAVQALTEEAMGKTGITQALYTKRLDLVQPTASQLAQLGNAYYAHLTPDVDRIIALLQRLHKAIYVVSAGIQRAVEDFAERFGIPKQNVFAVKTHFDAQGCYVDYDKNSPMTQPRGKRRVVDIIRQRHPRLVYTGDGINDTEVIDQVTRFVGYGGAYFRESIAERCDFYIVSRTFLPILPLILTETEQQALSEQDRAIFQAGLALIKAGQVCLQSTKKV